MLSTIEALCGETNNWFDEKRIIDDFTIEGGSMSLPFLSVGQFFRIVGSKFNDGLYVIGPEGIIRDTVEESESTESVLKDESFHGAVWALAIPKAFIQLAEEVKTYNASDISKPSVLVSESFGGYSYTKNSNDTDASWQNVFKTKLKRWRKVNRC